ncbi:hypothetical protein [Lactiplantibacillus plantarum]|uniref:hypothetical protein n=1 Tax=Lactiplantibacillus plantarum TaxID=1590 RepID=UPI00097755AC|nr:hypothetical protein [Lactiplantibacillus plantarum]
MTLIVKTQIVKLNRLTKPIDAVCNYDLNEYLILRQNDVVLVGWPDTNDLQIGIIKQTPIDVLSVSSDSPVVVSRVDWPSKSLRALVAKFKLALLLETMNDN